jgi:hypothetical protein
MARDNFTGLLEDSLAISGNRGRVFWLFGRGLGHHGIYLFDGSTLSVVADQNTPIPNGTGTFVSFFPRAVNGDKVAFRAGMKHPDRAVYTYSMEAH